MPVLHVPERRVGPGKEDGLPFVLPTHAQVLVSRSPDHLEDLTESRVVADLVPAGRHEVSRPGVLQPRLRRLCHLSASLSPTMLPKRDRADIRTARRLRCGELLGRCQALHRSGLPAERRSWVEQESAKQPADESEGGSRMEQSKRAFTADEARRFGEE